MALSPDGNWVAASVAPGGGKRERLVLLPTGAGEMRVLNDRLKNFVGAGWLPDGKSLVFSAHDEGHEARIRVQSLEGGDARPLSGEGVSIPRTTNAVSPDGKLVLGIDGSGKASVYPVDGGPPRPVAGLEASEVPLHWSEDGRFLYVYRRSGPPPHDVWRLDPASGTKTRWLEISPREETGEVDLVLSRDGRSYVYGTQRVLSELYIVEGLR